MSERGTVTLDQVVSLARQLSALEKVRLIERHAPDIERDLSRQEGGQKRPLRSLLGLCADLGTAPSAEDIDEIRQEMWAGFPRGDI